MPTHERVKSQIVWVDGQYQLIMCAASISFLTATLPKYKDFNNATKTCQKLLESYQQWTINDTCEIVKLPPRYASLYKKVRDLPKKENGAQSPNYPSHPPRSRIDDSITGLEENSQCVNHGDGPNIFC